VAAVCLLNSVEHGLAFWICTCCWIASEIDVVPEPECMQGQTAVANRHSQPMAIWADLNVDCRRGGKSHELAYVVGFGRLMNSESTPRCVS